MSAHHMPATTGNTRAAGFTLLELIIVIFLIGILLVVSVPALRDGILRDPLRTSGRKMIGYLQSVREQSVREQQSYLLYFDLDEQRLWHRAEAESKPNDTEPPEKGVLQMLSGVSIRDLYTKSNGARSRGVRELWISRQGYLEETVIHLEDDGGEVISLVLAPFISAIEVKDGYYEPQ